MAKKVSESKELEFYEGVKLFVGTGKSKHLPLGYEVEVNYELAKILVEKQAIELR